MFAPLIDQMGQTECLKTRQYSKVKIARASVAAALFFASLPANSSVAPMTYSIAKPAETKTEMKSSAATMPSASPVILETAQIEIPMDITTSRLNEYSKNPYAAIDESTKELNLALLKEAAKVADSHKFNPADYVPYRSLNANSASQVPTKILAQTLQTFIQRDTAADSIFNSPIIKNAGYTKSIEQKNYKITYGIRNTLAQTELKFHKNMTASLSYNLASPEVNFGIHWSF